MAQRSPWLTLCLPSRRRCAPRAVVRRGGVLAVLFATAIVGAPGSAAGQTATGIAQARHEAGLSLYDAESYEEALVEFRASFAARSSPVPRLYIARCLRKLERLAEAIEAYHQTRLQAADLSEERPDYEEVGVDAEEEREAIIDLVGWLTLEADNPPPNLTLHLGDRELPVQALGISLPIDPGTPMIRAESEGMMPFEQTLEIAAGDEVTVQIILSAEVHDEPVQILTPADDGDPRRTGLMVGTFVSLGLAIAGGVAAFVLHALAEGAHTDLLEQCPEFVCDQSTWNETLRADRDRGDNLSSGFYAAVAATSVTTAVFVILAAITPWSRSDGPVMTTRAGVPALALHF